MQRRTYLKAALALAAAGSTNAQTARQSGGIQLHLDLAVDPSREQEMIKTFREVFKPTVSKQPGYIDVQIMKLRSAMMGNKPGDANYRFVLRFESEDLRQKWVASDDHQQAWPALEKTLKHKNYNVLLYEIA